MDFHMSMFLDIVIDNMDSPAIMFSSKNADYLDSLFIPSFISYLSGVQNQINAKHVTVSQYLQVK